VKALIARVQAIVARVMQWRAVRVFQLYGQKNGPILAGGLSLTALYSVFAALYVGFTVLGFAIRSDPEFEKAVLSTISTAVPGLIDTGSGSGAIKVDDLFSSKVLGWSGIVAIVIVFVTALSWFASARSAVRAVFGLPQDTTFFLLLKLRDLVLVIAFAAVTLLSAAISVFSTAALGVIFGAVGIGEKSVFAVVVARVIGLVIAFAIDTAVLVVLFRVLLAVKLPLRRLITGAMLGAAALGILKAFGAALVGGGGRNPLLASFAVMIGLLVWFGLICQVILIAATWMAVDLADHGETPILSLKTKTIGRPTGRRRPATKAVGPPR
jgi:membrane protein